MAHARDPVQNVGHLRFYSKSFEFFLTVKHFNNLPSFLLRRAHAANLAVWTRSLPLVHGKGPAQLATAILEATIEELEASDDVLATSLAGTGDPLKYRQRNGNLTIISLDATSGDGITTIEQCLNDSRTRKLNIKLTDPRPNHYLDDWMRLASSSEQVHFLPGAIDTASQSEPPPAVMSKTSASYDPARSDVRHSALILYLWLGSFHAAYTARKGRSARHSPSEADSLLPRSTPSQQSIKHALRDSDAFAIFSLEDRRLISVISVMLLRFWYLWLTIVLWFPWHRDVLALLCSFPVPVVPALGAWEALKSALWTRTFDEMIELVDSGLGFSTTEPKSLSWFEPALVDGRRSSERAGWVFEGRRVRYRWPLGYLSSFVGRRIDVRSRRRSR